MKSERALFALFAGSRICSLHLTGLILISIAVAIFGVTCGALSSSDDPSGQSRWKIGYWLLADE